MLRPHPVPETSNPAFGPEPVYGICRTNCAIEKVLLLFPACRPASWKGATNLQACKLVLSPFLLYIQIYYNVLIGVSFNIDIDLDYNVDIDIDLFIDIDIDCNIAIDICYNIDTEINYNIDIDLEYCRNKDVS